MKRAPGILKNRQFFYRNQTSPEKQAFLEQKNFDLKRGNKGFARAMKGFAGGMKGLARQTLYLERGKGCFMSGNNGLELTSIH